MMPDKEYLIFCDESDASGKYYSNFYGGVLVGSSQVERMSRFLNAEKQRLNLYGEVKWSKVSETYLAKYRELICSFFREIAAGNARVRVMFRHNIHAPTDLTFEQIGGTYFRLYYQFIKHAFGLSFHPPIAKPRRVRLFFDEFPETKEEAAQFKGFILALRDSAGFRRAGPDNLRRGYCGNPLP